MESSLYKVRKAVSSDINGMLALNYAIYPEEWHVDKGYVERNMQINDEVYNVLQASGGIKGIFSLFPLTRDDYESMLCGTLEEEELPRHLLPYDAPRHVCLYLISFIVDIHDPLRKAYAKALIQAIPDELRRLESEGIIVDEIGAIAITDDGRRVLKRIGFTAAEKVDFFGQTFQVYRARPEDLYQAIKLG
ncbi:hypothetical protein QYF50_10450 [Paenibacillus vini]|uniref:hypothetical protein n=1 Tax=Paenibacillus vini TaxID=1476024 RepID=UPI0025B6BA42|nr:hypothetical protein [Paenibacillus vini]MDN4068308.1 hypothetical protein [Paenibacillus vini]